MTEEPTNVNRRSNFIPFKYPNFGKLLTGQLVSNIGSQFSYIAILFLVYDLTGEIYAMALLSMAQAIPMILIGPWAGVVIDKVDRKYAMVFADLSQGCAIMIIPFTSSFPDDIRLWWIVGVAFCNAAFARFFYPARGASIPKLVEDNKDLLAANSLSVGTYQTSALIGPLFAGIIIGLFGYDIPFFIDSLSFFFSVVCILLIDESLKATNASTQKPFQDLITGGKYILNFLPLLYLLIIFSGLMFTGGASMILIVPYLETEFHLGEGTREFVFGLLTSFSAMVGLLIALNLSRKAQISKPVTLISVTTVIAGIILIILGAAPNLWVVGMAWIGFGAIEVFIGIPLQTITQETVPDMLRGKIFSFINLSITVSQIIGMGIVSVIASTVIGIRRSLILSGITLCVFFVIGVIILRKEKLESLVTQRREELIQNPFL
ncbi:MAG: MFS transporter [Candidatus Thorarchaeota archaeon]